MLKKQRDDGKAFMENVYNARKEEKVGDEEVTVIIDSATLSSLS